MFEPILNSSVSATRKKTLNLTTYLIALGIYLCRHGTKSLVLSNHKCQETWDTSYWFIGISASWWTNICCKYYSYIFPILSGIQDLILIKWPSLFFDRFRGLQRQIDIALGVTEVTKIAGSKWPDLKVKSWPMVCTYRSWGRSMDGSLPHIVMSCMVVLHQLGNVLNSCINNGLRKVLMVDLI